MKNICLDVTELGIPDVMFSLGMRRGNNDNQELSLKRKDNNDESDVNLTRVFQVSVMASSRQLTRSCICFIYPAPNKFLLILFPIIITTLPTTRQTANN